MDKTWANLDGFELLCRPEKSDVAWGRVTRFFSFPFSFTFALLLFSLFFTLNKLKGKNNREIRYAGERTNLQRVNGLVSLSSQTRCVVHCTVWHWRYYLYAFWMALQELWSLYSPPRIPTTFKDPISPFTKVPPNWIVS